MKNVFNIAIAVLLLMSVPAAAQENASAQTVEEMRQTLEQQQQQLQEQEQLLLKLQQQVQELSGNKKHETGRC